MSVSLKRAVAYYDGSLHYFNPLWEKIGQSFGDYICAGFQHPSFMSKLYCSEREAGTGGYAKEDDVREHVAGDEPSFLLLLGKTGVGKSTFLHKILDGRPDTFFVDMLLQLPARSPPEAVERVFWRILTSELRLLRGEPPPGTRSLEDFFLLEMPDEDGALEFLRGRVAPGQRMEPEDARAFQDLITRFHERQREAYARLLVRYLREVLRKRPVLVLDNLDQLPQESIATAIDLAKFFAASSQPGGKVDGLKVIAAVREGTWQDFSARASTSRVARVAPPKLSRVLDRRVQAFLKNFPQKVLEGTRLVVHSKTFELSKHLASDADVTDLGAEVIRLLCSAMEQVAIGENETMGQRIHRMCDDNTRQSLVAFTSYTASNHIPFLEILGALLDAPDLSSAEERTAAILATANSSQLLRALMLGVSPVFGVGGRRSWVMNLLNDGAREDQASLLVRPYTLKAVLALDDARKGVDSRRIMDVLEETAGFAPDRVETCLDELHRSYSLIDDLSPNKSGRASERRVRISAAGRKYLTLLRDFDGYLRFVTPDVWVHEGNLRRCHSVEEAEYEAVLRVMGVCKELRDAEVRVLSSSIGNGVAKDLHAWLQEDLVCVAVGDAIRRKLERFSLGQGSEDEVNWSRFVERLAWADVQDDARRMAADSSTAGRSDTSE